MNKILVLCGATASGKSELAVNCAKQLNGEIISADALAVYKQLNIGTAKPTLEQRSSALHHLIDVVSPFDKFSVNDFEQKAIDVVDRLLAEGKLPIICGGTGFYIKSVLYKNQFGNSASNEEVRAKYTEIYEKFGKEYLFELLRSVDSQSAEKLHPNDVKRVIRALEIFECSGKKKSEQRDEEIPRYSYAAIFLDRPRDELYSRINARVDLMMKNGLLDEVRALVALGVTDKNQCMQGIGYKELFAYLTGQTDYAFAVEQIKQNTRNYAKRQITFFKRLNGVRFINADDCNVETVKNILELTD